MLTTSLKMKMSLSLYFPKHKLPRPARRADNTVIALQPERNPDTFDHERQELLIILVKGTTNEPFQRDISGRHRLNGLTQSLVPTGPILSLLPNTAGAASPAPAVRQRAAAHHQLHRA
jgi:hypothetical protein